MLRTFFPVMASIPSRISNDELIPLSTDTTSYPDDIRSTMVWLPMYPHPPVTSILAVLNFNGCLLMELKKVCCRSNGKVRF